MSLQLLPRVLAIVLASGISLGNAAASDTAPDGPVITPAAAPAASEKPATEKPAAEKTGVAKAVEAISTSTTEKPAGNPADKANQNSSDETAEKLPPPPTAAELRLERAARDFRIQTYETFRKDRAEYDRRQAAGADLERAWKEAGSNPDDRDTLVDWFEQATAGSRADAIAELPASPTFVAIAPKKNADKKFIETGDKETGDLSDESSPAASPAPSQTDRPGKPHDEPPAKSGKPSAIGSLPLRFEADLAKAIDSLAGKKPAERSDERAPATHAETTKPQP